MKRRRESFIDGKGFGLAKDKVTGTLSDTLRVMKYGVGSLLLNLSVKD